MNQSEVLVEANFRFHHVIPLGALLGLTHYGIPLPLLVRGEAGRRDQGRVDDGGLPHRHATRTEVGFDSFKDLLAKLVLLQQLAEGQGRDFIRNPVTDQIDTGKATYGEHLNQGLFHSRVGEQVPLLQQVDLHRRLQRV